MIALTEIFDQWILNEADISPANRTLLVELSVDFERIAGWVGPEWIAANPTDGDRPWIFKFTAGIERRSNPQYYDQRVQMAKAKAVVSARNP